MAVTAPHKSVLYIHQPICPCHLHPVKLMDMWPINFVRFTTEQECNLHHVLQERFIEKPDTSRKMGISN